MSKQLPWKCPNCNNMHRGKQNEKSLYHDVPLTDELVCRTCYLCNFVLQVKVDPKDISEHTEHSVSNAKLTEGGKLTHG